MQETREEDDGSDGNSDCDVRGMKARKDDMKRETMDTDITGRKDERKENRGDAEKKERGGKTRDRKRQTKRRVDEAARSEEEIDGNNELSGQKVGGNGKGEWTNIAGGKDGRKEGEKRIVTER